MYRKCFDISSKILLVQLMPQQTLISCLMQITSLRWQNICCCLQEMKQLCSHLMDLRKASAEEMRRSVYANYAAFIR